MLYLTDKYDKEGKASYSRDKDPEKYYEILQWLFFQNAGIGPMQGQANRTSPQFYGVRLRRLLPLCPRKDPVRN